MTATPVRIRGVDYPSQAAAAKALGLSHHTIYSALERGTIDHVGRGQGWKRRYIRLGGVLYRSIAEAGRAYGRSKNFLNRIERNLRAQGRTAGPTPYGWVDFNPGENQ